MTIETDRAAFDAAYDALQPYTQHAQVRAAIAEHIVATVRNYHPYAAVDVAWATWPENTTRINKAVLADIVQAAYAPIELERWKERPR